MSDQPAPDFHLPSSALAAAPRSALRIWLRLSVSLLFLMLAAQVAFIAGYLGGGATLELHRVNAFFVIAAALLAFAIAIFYFAVAHGPRWPIVMTGTMCLLLVVEERLGSHMVIGLHIPLGVATVALSLLLLVSIWSPLAFRASVSEPPPSASPEAPYRWSGYLLWSLRIVATVYYALFVWQILLAGLFASGDVGRLKLHSSNADNVSTSMTIAMVIAALFAWVSRGARWPFFILLTLIGLVAAQFGFGYRRIVPWHVANGTLMFALSTLLVIGLWRQEYRQRPRKIRKSKKTEDSVPANGADHGKGYAL